jgi:hypothetical protein
MNNKLEILYYSRNQLVDNQSIYNPSSKNNPDKLDICFLEQVKSDLYSEEGLLVGVFQALNSYRTDARDGINTGMVTIKTNKGLISWINSYDVGTSDKPFLRKTDIISKAIYAEGEYLLNGFDNIYIKIIPFNDTNGTRKIEIYY